MAPRVFVTRPIFQEAVDLLSSAAGTSVWPEDLPPPYAALRSQAAEADGLFTLLTDRIDSPLLESSPRLRVVGNMAVGYDNIDVAAATAKGVYIGNTPGVLTETTADFAFALLASWARRVPQARDFARSGEWKTWSPMSLLGADLHASTLGIVGLGRIGCAVARRARGFDMRVLYHTRTRRPEVETELGVEYVPGLHEMLAASDFVTLHAPLSEATRGLFGRAELASMRPTAVLINTSRGEIVDQDALHDALASGGIAGAALDVTNPEPLQPSHPLYALDNVLITPHIASASQATRLKMAMMAAQNIVDVLEGRPPTHCVNPEAGRDGP